MADRGGIDATHNAPMGDNRGLMVVTVPREVPIWMAGALSMPLTMRKWVIVEVWWLFQSQGDCQYGWQGGRGSIDATHKVQMGVSRGLVVVVVSR